MNDVTVLIPVLRSQRNDEWLQECVTGFPAGTKYLVAENDGDLAGALNEALALVDTTWVMPFGHDDVPDEHLLDQLVEFGHDADVVYPSMLLTDETLRPLSFDKDGNPNSFFTADIFCGNRLQTWNYVPGGFIARTETVRKIGGWRDLEALEDWDLHVRMFRAGARFKANPNAKFAYRQVPGSRNKIGERFASPHEMRKHFQSEIVGTIPDVKATFYYQATPAVSYWRCVLPARHLPGVATSQLEGVPREGGGIEYLDHQGAAVFQFPGNKERAQSLLGMQLDGFKYLVETDDNYLDTMDTLFRTRTGWASRIGAAHHSVQGHRWITENADGVIVTTRKLAEIYGEVNDNIFICRNSIDPADLPPYEKPDDGVFRVGWIASLSHDRDADMIRKAMSWASRQPGVEVVNIGLGPAGWNFDRLQYGWSDDLVAYKKTLQLLDVGMAPILHTSSAVCRSDLKILEYACAGAMTVAQRLDPYAEWFDHPDVLTASTAKEFYDHIRWCVSHKDEAREMGQRARDYVLTNRTIQSEIKAWEAAVAC